jgi:hypothetical protein
MRHSRAIAAWLLCASFLAGAMHVFGHRQMGALDDNIVIDTAWRMFTGQRPYVDFYLPLSPEFYLGAGWAFRLGGANWSALVLISVIFAVFTFALQSIALSHMMRARYAISISLVCQMLAMMVTSYWWYNSNASITACLLFSVSLALTTNPASKTLAILFCISLIMMSVMKVNVAGVSMLVVLLPLLSLRQLQGKLILWVAGSALVVLVLLMAAHLNPVDIFKAYLQMAGSRGLPDVRNLIRSKPNEIFITLPLLGACFAAFVVVSQQVFRAPRERRPAGFRQTMFIASSGMLVGVWCILMSTEESLISGIPLILLSSSSVIVWAREARIVDLEAPLALTIVLLLCACATLAGLVLFDRLPFPHLVGRSGLRLPYMALLMSWSFCAVMSVVAFAASLGFSSHWERIRLRSWSLLPVVLMVAGASGAFVVIARGLPSRTPHVFVPYVGLLILWSVFAVVAVLPFATLFKSSPLWDRRVVERFRRWSAVLVILIATTAAAAFYVSGKRLRVRINGAFYSREPGVAVGLPLFEGFSVSPGLKAAADQIAAVLAEYKAQGHANRNVFFGVRLEFAYAAFGIASPTGLPLWWDPAAAYPAGEEPQIVERFIAHRFPLCIFYGRGPKIIFLPEGIVEELAKNYRRVEYSEITVFVRDPAT